MADQVHLVPELLLQAIDDGDLRLDPASALAGRRIVVHAHCHEKAVTGTRATVELLRRIPGARSRRSTPAAAAWPGRSASNPSTTTLSMRIGALRLFPSLAAEDADVIVAATGVSCRQQIAHGTPRRACHPVELVRTAVI